MRWDMDKEHKILAAPQYSVIYALELWKFSLHTATSAEVRGNHFIIQITSDSGQELPHLQTLAIVERFCKILLLLKIGEMW